MHPQSVRPLDGRVRRRLDDRPGQPAGHAAADRARPGLAGPGARTPPPAVDWTQAAHLGVRPAGRRGVPGRRPGHGAPARPGGAAPAIFNAANEECVAAFLAGRLPFLGIVDTVARVLDEHAPDFGEPGTVEDVLAAEVWARARAQEHASTADGWKEPDGRSLGDRRSSRSAILVSVMPARGRSHGDGQGASG